MAMQVSQVNLLELGPNWLAPVQIISLDVLARALHGTGAGLNLSKMTGVGHNFENFNIVKA